MSASRTRKRILVVENDPGVRQATQDTLALEGYQVYAAEGAGEELVRQAHSLLRMHRCHAIVLDLRLFSDNDPDDWSGLKFALEIQEFYPWVACALLTGYGSFDLARQALAGPGAAAVDIVLKAQGPQALVDAVDRIFSEHIKRRWDQHLIWANDLSPEDVLMPLIHLDIEQQLSKSIIQSEFEEMLGWLFPDADKLRLAKLSDYARSTSLTQGRSVLLRVEPHQDNRWLEGVAVKIGNREVIQREVTNYDRYVKGQIGDHRHTSRQAHIVTWHLGGIAYTLIGAGQDAKTLKEFYRQAKLDKVEALGKIFHRLFRRLFHHWYGKSELVHLNLWDEYRQTLDLSEERLSRLDWGKSEQVEFAGLSRPLLNPLRWIEKHAANSDVQTCRHTTHGDLHSRNIFVGPNHGVWLIDFERTGVGHGLRDLIELETDIKFSLLSLEESNTRLFYSFESRLLAPDTSVAAQNIQPPLDVSKHSQANLAFQAIVNLRQLAAGKARPDMRDYYWGLLCQTLFVATLSHLPGEARRRAKLSAALICERLGDGRRLRELWPPGLDATTSLDQHASERRQLTELHQILITYFGEDELRTLCFHLGVDHENLPGEKSSLAMKLVTHLERRDRIPELVNAIRQRRPNISLDNIS